MIQHITTFCIDWLFRTLIHLGNPIVMQFFVVTQSVLENCSTLYTFNICIVLHIYSTLFYGYLLFKSIQMVKLRHRDFMLTHIFSVPQVEAHQLFKYCFGLLDTQWHLIHVPIPFLFALARFQNIVFYS